MRKNKKNPISKEQKMAGAISRRDRVIAGNWFRAK